MEKRLSPSVLLTILLCYKTERDTDTSSSFTVNSFRICMFFQSSCQRAQSLVPQLAYCLPLISDYVYSLSLLEMKVELCLYSSLCWPQTEQWYCKAVPTFTVIWINQPDLL